MAQAPEYSKMTKAQLTALARRKKIPVKSGALKEDLVKAIKKGLRKIEAQKKSKPSTTAKTRKRTAAIKTKKRSTQTSKAKTQKKPRSATRKTGVAKRAKASPKKVVRKPSAIKKKTQKTAAHKPKTTRPKKSAQPVPRSLPGKTPLPVRYGDHRLVILPRDPNWAYAYWDLDPKRVRDLESRPGQARWVLRVYSAPLQPVEHKGAFFDVEVNVNDESYYLDLSRPGARFIVEIGVVDASGMFRATAQSNPVILPMDHPSDKTAEQGIVPSKEPPLKHGGSAMPGASPTVPIPEALTSPRGTSFFKPPSSRSR